MKVFVTYENSFEKTLADNLVKVLKKIGHMLAYGKVTDAGVMLEDWASKPKVNLECSAVEIAPQGSASVMQSMVQQKPFYPVSMTAEFQYNPDGKYYAAVLNPPNPPSMGMTREAARELVRLLPNATPPTKRKVPKPNTTKTGVTIRAIDIDDDHEEE